MISPLGHNLSVVIRSEYRHHHQWMAFASWYSISKILPDAKISLVCSRSDVTYDFFGWPKKVGVPMRLYSPPGKDTDPRLFAAHVALRDKLASQPMMLVDADTMMLRELPAGLLEFMDKTTVLKSTDDSIWYFKDQPKETLLRVQATQAVLLDDAVVCDAKDEYLSAFSSYRNGVGNFVTTEWIDRSEYPFPYADRFAGSVLTANELQILKLWKQMNPVFEIVSRT